MTGEEDRAFRFQVWYLELRREAVDYYWNLVRENHDPGDEDRSER
jgi:hypothetical protein